MRQTPWTPTTRSASGTAACRDRRHSLIWPLRHCQAHTFLEGAQRCLATLAPNTPRVLRTPMAAEATKRAFGRQLCWLERIRSTDLRDGPPAVAGDVQHAAGRELSVTSTTGRDFHEMAQRRSPTTLKA